MKLSLLLLLLMNLHIGAEENRPLKHVTWQTSETSNKIIHDQVIARSPLKISATYEIEPGGGTELTVTVQTKNGPICFNTDESASSDEAIDEFKRRLTVDGPYVFVPNRHWGCNNMRCSGFLVFKTGESVIYLGYISQGSTDEGVPYKDGLFGNIYDAFERRSPNSHAQDPRFDMVLREDGDKLLLDPSETWKANLELIGQAKSLTHTCASKDSECRWKSTDTLLSYASLCKVVDRKSDFNAAIKQMKTILPKETYEASMKCLRGSKAHDPNLVCNACCDYVPEPWPNH